MLRLCLVLMYLWCCCHHCYCHNAGLQQDLVLVLNASQSGTPFPHFWQSTGFCPPKPHQDAAGFDLGPDMIQNLAYIGAVPHCGIQQVRIHWLLDLVKVEGFSSGQPVYNFTFLDQMVDLLHQNGLRPGFEIMGSPSGIFTDMENKTQVYWWRDLVRQVAERYIDHYGLDYVKQWNFETWNEPDCHDFDEVQMTVNGFLNYYDACSEGLKAASPQLVFGGPGDGCNVVSTKKNSTLKVLRGNDFAYGLFGHVVNGTNYFTGETGVRMDFISLHRKGEGKASTILNTELETIEEIKRRYPSLVHTPFYNDEADPLGGWNKDEQWRATASYAAMAVKVSAEEWFSLSCVLVFLEFCFALLSAFFTTGKLSSEADPLVGWSKDEWWRATATYAAVAVKVIAQHQNMLIATGHSPINFTLLSNDNGFLSYYPHQFTQRTLVTRFQMNSTTTLCSNASIATAAHKSQSAPASSHENYVTFVRKPIYAAMCLLSKLGDQQLPAHVADSLFKMPLPNDSYAGVLATVHVPSDTSTSDSWQTAALVYSSADTNTGRLGGKLSFQWYINPSSSSSDLMLAVYAVSDNFSNPYWWWDTQFHRPDFPSLQQFSAIRKNEGPYRTHLLPVAAKPGYISVPPVEMHEPDVHLFHLCEKSSLAPEQVTDVRMINITAGQLLIRWSDANIRTKCIKTYEIELSKAGSQGPYQQINSQDAIVNVFVFASDSEGGVRGFYRVRAVDYWQRPGQYSVSVAYGTE
ncbi:hypothetical protein BaRGS_00012265 [Batillaria attramentaria]|uniref:Alpha-L-iduronidase n=1 Tax=Batillaria attramentaria TaxID=370345 RepID=A0ABD0LB59_9CAEN